MLVKRYDTRTLGASDDRLAPTGVERRCGSAWSNLVSKGAKDFLTPISCYEYYREKLDRKIAIDKTIVLKLCKSCAMIGKMLNNKEIERGKYKEWIII